MRRIANAQSGVSKLKLAQLHLHRARSYGGPAPAAIASRAGRGRTFVNLRVI